MSDLDPYESVPVPNLPLLRKTLDYIKIPGVWDQASWMHTTKRSECGTAGCIAGWAVSLTDQYDMIFERHEETTDADLHVDTVVDRVTGKREFLEVVARRELGLTEDEAEMLFDGINGYRTIIALCESIAERAGEKL